ncbi:hypothetical protein CsSME_00015429 [Camellia sinensis var. sinensis]
MEDIEDLLVGSGGAPAGFRLPITASVSVNPKKKKKKKNQQSDLNNHSSIQPSLTASHSPKIPGTQTIYMKTFGCSHNQVSVLLYLLSLFLRFGDNHSLYNCIQVFK